MAWSVPPAGRPLSNESALRYGLGMATAPLWAPFLAAAGAGVAWWWATAWTRRPMPQVASLPRRIEVKADVAPAPAPTIAPVTAPTTVHAIEAGPPQSASEVAADVHAVAALETAPVVSDADAVKAAVAEVIARSAGDGDKPVRRKAGPKPAPAL